MRPEYIANLPLKEKQRLMHVCHENSKRFWSDPENRKKQSQRISLSKRIEKENEKELA